MFKKMLCLFALCFYFTLQAEAEKEIKTHRIFQFENEYVRVWKTVIMPHQPLKMHRHDCSRVIVGLKGGVLTKIEQSGGTSPLAFDTGVAYWLEEDPKNTLHADVNESDEPIEVMVIEMKATDIENL